MANAKHEDAVMKMGFDYFRNTILKTLGIDYQYEFWNCFMQREFVQQSWWN